MDNKDRIKKIKRAMARYAFYFFSAFFRVLPYPLVRAMTNALIALGFVVVKRMRKIARESLTIAFGREKSGQEIEGIVRTCFFNLGRSAIEMLYFTQRPQMITAKLAFAPGARENLDAALAEGRGVIAVTAHFGNFPLMLLYLARMGYKTNAIIRPARDEAIEKTFQDTRTRLGLHTIYSYPRVECVKESLRVLRNKEILCVPLDQNFGTGGVFVEFFGQKAATATGPVVFATRTGAVILPIFIARDTDDRHKIMTEPHFAIETRATDEETIQYNVAKITGTIETYIRRYPHEWGWMHRRWKSKPAYR
ncbi:MAG: lysophospholipid acyltransferase family protein [Candidatus Omnitrophica bacterium]|nr:lysophospholipid acyltransferase family protein [Candidatus Omnitrophota bacterium]